MKTIEGQVKLECTMTFEEKMKADGWHNVYQEKPEEPGTYKIFKRNGTKGTAYYCGNNVWQYAGGWDFCWWKKM